MKKAIIILIISLFTCTALFAQEQAYEYKPLVEPGKTWWYEAHTYIPPEKRYKRITLGIRLSETVNIDGIEWHTCRIVEPDNRNEALDPIIAYIRQDGTKVFYRPGEFSGFENDIYNEILSYTYQYEVDPEHLPTEGILVFDFSAGLKKDGMKTAILYTDSITSSRSYTMLHTLSTQAYNGKKLYAIRSIFGISLTE